MVEKQQLAALISELSDLSLITDPGRLERFSRDFAWFSPILTEQLADKRADLVVRPNDETEIKRVIAACHRHRVPLTLRGSGTGNYGQCTPLEGGVVMDMSALNQVRWIEGGVARVQAGTRLVNIDKEARPKGWEMRLLPSTYRLATAGGFYCGGFGGVGSITYGSIGDPGNVLGVRALSLEAEPRELELRGREALDLYHAYGVNGIITEIEFALAPAYDWQEALLTFPDFMEAVRFCQTLGRASGVIKKLLTVLADPLPQMCGLEEQVPAGRTAVLCIVAKPSFDATRELCEQYGGAIALTQEHADVYGTAHSLIEHAWNHTTLHIFKRDKGITYLQSGFRPWENVEKSSKCIVTSAMR
ncbi:FAD-binding oxidoreductase [Alkalilimnicola ehrlichii]|uniref:FAD-binding oxidoreductase n=1 Tax=Alkalilimnicola ehrlichii TaxID=351052 RepID=UPI001C6F4901|nr:FAD-binding oxidoreductase [Alkalilimnicola ehrlichii]